MIQQFNIKKNLNKETAKSIIKAWMLKDNKVFHLKSNIQKEYIRDFYEKIGNKNAAYGQGFCSSQKKASEL